jgi:hypothetical protein
MSGGLLYSMYVNWCKLQNTALKDGRILGLVNISLKGQCNQNYVQVRVLDPSDRCKLFDRLFTLFYSSIARNRFKVNSQKVKAEGK